MMGIWECTGIMIMSVIFAVHAQINHEWATAWNCHPQVLRWYTMLHQLYLWYLGCWLLFLSFESRFRKTGDACDSEGFGWACIVIKYSLIRNCHIPLSELYRKKRQALQWVLKRNALLLQAHIKGWKWQWWLFQTPAGSCGYPSFVITSERGYVFTCNIMATMSVTYIYNSSPTSLARKIHSSIPYKLWIFPFLFIITIYQHRQFSDSSVSAVPVLSVVLSLITVHVTYISESTHCSLISPSAGQFCDLTAFPPSNRNRKFQFVNDILFVLCGNCGKKNVCYNCDVCYF